MLSQNTPSSAHGKIRVCIRGIAGLLGSRLAYALKKHPDIEVVAGIAKKDQTLARFKNLVETIDPNKVPEMFSLARRFYLHCDPANTKKVCDELRGLPIEIIPCNEFTEMEKIAADCDVIVDATGESARLENIDKKTGKPVIIQSGEFPRGSVLVPPVIVQKEATFHRMGDCVQSALCPVIVPLLDVATHIRADVMMQFSDRLNDFTIGQRIHAQYIREDERAKMQANMKELFGDLVEIEGLRQIPGMEYYTVRLLVEMKTPKSPREIRELLSGKPRVFLAPNLNSTFEIDHHIREPLNAVGRDIPPAIVLGCDLDSLSKNSRIVLTVAVAYRYIAVLPNIDAVRILALGMNGEDAMAITDRNMGLA